MCATVQAASQEKMRSRQNKDIPVTGCMRDIGDVGVTSQASFHVIERGGVTEQVFEPRFHLFALNDFFIVRVFIFVLHA